MKLIPKRKMISPTPETMLDVIQNIYSSVSSAIMGDSSGGGGVQYSGIAFIIDGGGATITAGEKGHVSVPFNCEILAGELSATPSGSITVDIWKGTIGNFPPTDANTITGSSPLAISGGLTEFDSALTGWTKKINRFNILAFNVDSCSTITRCTVTLHVKRT